MNQEAYENFVARIEAQAERNPSLYRVSLGGMAVLGYAYVAGVLVVLLAALAWLGWMVIHGSGAVVALKVGILVVPLIWAVVRAMFIRIEPPTGRKITAREAPELLRLVEDVRRRAKAPRADEVLVTADFNASVVQHPRLGVFGWPRNYLVLGLPLMQALSVDEFRAVVAHEFGHLSGAHGKFGAWIYRLRAGWARLACALDESNHWGKFLFVPFFNWYAPTFGAYSFVQARRQEYEADRVSAAASGANVAGAALIRVELQAQFLDGAYWRDIFREADMKEQPDARPFSAMKLALAQERPAQEAMSSLESALKRRTGVDDTHPCLADRLRALGATATLPVPLETSAAEALFGATLAATLAGEFDQHWHMNVAYGWKERYQHATQSRSKLAELDALAANQELSVEDACQRALLTEEFATEAAALEQLEALAPRATQHAPTLFALGRLRLARDDDSGLKLLEEASKLDASCGQVSGALIVDYLKRHGRDAEARPHIDNLTAATEMEMEARKERSRIESSDKLLPHGLPPDRLRALAAQLADQDQLLKAYLVRKQTRYYPDVPMYVLAVERRRRWWMPESSDAAQKFVDQLFEAITAPGDILLVSIEDNNARSRFSKVAESLIYRRKK